ncbi:MAG TPA: HAMP domain-containing sensor histidine kinase [Thermoanaerobaculia bacterium]
MKAKETATKRDELLSLVSHEMKNPLTSIAGYTLFAEDAVKNHDHALALESLQVVRCEAQRVLRLAEDLLDIAQLRTGKFSVKMDIVNLKEIVETIANRYSTVTGRQIAVAVSSAFPRIAGDGVRLAQVIENLVSNATKYSPEDTPIRVTMDCSASRVTVCVWNNGALIPPEQLPLIFKRFSRLGNGDGHIKGTGLGLYISKQIVELHGGTIGVLSSAGEGTCFSVELPRQIN